MWTLPASEARIPAEHAESPGACDDTDSLLLRAGDLKHTTAEYNASGVHHQEGGLPKKTTADRRRPMCDRPGESQRIGVVDFFSGCGGTSAGLRAAGMDILAGIDIDREAAGTFQRNFPEAKVIRGDITKLKTSVLRPSASPD